LTSNHPSFSAPYCSVLSTHGNMQAWDQVLVIKKVVLPKHPIKRK
jgi:hypothetical protein